MTDQTERQIVRRMIEIHRDALEDEFGPFTLVDSPDPHRVLLIPDNATSREDWSACYRSDSSPDARLLVDDYVPEATE